MADIAIAQEKAAADIRLKQEQFAAETRLEATKIGMNIAQGM
jgi:hypothetical protein